MEIIVVDGDMRRLVGGQAVFAGAFDHVLDHLHQAHVHAVVGVVDALHAVGLQLADFLGGDGAAAAAEYADVAGAALAQHVDHVLEVFDVAALVGRHRDCVGIFLQRGADHVLDAAVVAEVDDFGARPWIRRRMMLIAASCPSNRLAAVTKRKGEWSCCVAGRLEAGVLMRALMRDRPRL